MRALLLLPLLLLPVRPASAVRPTEGGMFSFDPTDVVESWDDPTGVVRVHYSIEGPNDTRLDDEDADGVPDFPQDVAITTAEVLGFYADDLGLRPPIGEEEMGLGELGGSYALDVYLIDFGSGADGAFGIDECLDAPRHCSGYLTIENDFFQSGYPSLQNAIDVLTSHELFHGVQAAYDAEQEVWFSEGTAVWGEKQFDPDSVDFLWFADEYLADSGRSIDRPPSGPVPSFAYATCLWWDFLTTRHDPALMNELLEATETLTGDPVDTPAEMEAVIGARGDDLEEAWIEFVTWNLATGSRAGEIESYDYADQLDGITAESNGPSLEDDNRFYPLAATYYRLDHGGGPVWFGIEEPAADLHFLLFPVADGADDGPVETELASWTGVQAGSWSVVDDAPAGGYWLVGTYPFLAEESIKVRFCLGDSDAAMACGDPIDVGDDDDDDDSAADDDDDDGCSCDGTGGAGRGWYGLAAAIALFAVVRRRPRRTERTTCG